MTTCKHHLLISKISFSFFLPKFGLLNLSEIEVERVPVKSFLVEGLAPGVKLSTLEAFFKSKRQASGGPNEVKEVVTGYVVTFHEDSGG